MNLFLQIGLGLFPGTLVTILLLFKRRAFQAGKILCTLLLTAGCVATVAMGGKNLATEIAEKSEVLSQKETMAFANALIMEGAFEEAQEVIDEYSEYYGYDYECSLACARMNLLQEDYERAAGIYGYLCEYTELVDSEADEVIFANEKSGIGYADEAMVSYLKSLGRNPEEYGYTESDIGDKKYASKLTMDDVKDDIEKKVKKQYELSEQGKKCVKALVTIKNSYSNITSATDENQADDEADSISKIKKTFKMLEEEAPQYLQLACVKKARIKTYVMNGDFAEIAQSLTQNSSYHELMIAAELYMSGLIKAKDFSEEFQGMSKDQAVDLKNQIATVYEQNKDDLSNQEKKALKERVNAVNNELDDLVLATIKEELLEEAEEEAGTDKTKVYLEVAKIESYFDNEPSTDTYLSEAIYSSQDCEDDSYVEGMSNIISVINNDVDSDLESIKNVSEYVDTVLDHSLTVNVETLVSPQYQKPVEYNDSDIPGGNGYDFKQTAVDYVSRIKSAIVIGKIDTTNFEKVVARVQIDSNMYQTTEQIKAALKVYDCGAEIKDFELKKISYSGANIILVCDVSGSMGSGVRDLTNAVVTFINDKESTEKLEVATFESTISAIRPFGTSDEELIAFAESWRSGGGTDMYSAVLTCMEDFPVNDEEFNVLILMTDGQDNNEKSEATIRDTIGKLALEKGAVIYTMGLGSSVNTYYLTTIAYSGNGEFVYVSDSSSLEGFYNMLHGQVYSQYELTYTAKDTMTMSGRTLEVTLPAENTRDVKTYALPGGDEESNVSASSDLTVSGMYPRTVYKGLQDTEVMLKGTGFSQDSSVNVKLNGNIDYNLEGTFVDSENFKLVIPASIAVGTYNVEVNIDGKQKTISNGFSVVVQGEEKKTEFGPYIFTSAEKIEESGTKLVLRGDVTLNGWLHFKGDVVIEGDLETDTVRVTDYYGSYVSFDKATAKGIGQYFATKGIPVDVPAFNTFNLYNDRSHLYDYDNYQVDEINVRPITINNLLRFDSPSIQLRPDSVSINYKTGTTILPYQDQILATMGEELFKFEYEGRAVVTNENIGIIVNIEYEDADFDKKDNYKHQLNLLNNPVKFNGQMKVKIDTLKNEYTVGAMVNLPFFVKNKGIGAELTWKGKLIPDSIKVMADFTVPILETPVPIDAEKFSFMVSDINTACENKKWTSLVFTGAATINCGDVKQFFPALADFMGTDISVFSMPETTASLRLSPFRLEANASLFLLSEIKLAEAEVHLGQFEYTSEMLELDNVEVNGINAKLKQGLMWDGLNGRASLEVSGTGELDAHSRFVGVIYTGVAKYDFKWWFIDAEKSIDGSVAMGIYKTNSDKKEFILKLKYTNVFGHLKGKVYYIDENGKTGKTNGRLN